MTQYLRCVHDDLDENWTERMSLKTFFFLKAFYDVTLSGEGSRAPRAAGMISVRFLQWGRGGRGGGRGRNRSATVEQLVSSDRHKLLCQHLTLTATLAQTVTDSAVTAG